MIFTRFVCIGNVEFGLLKKVLLVKFPDILNIHEVDLNIYNINIHINKKDHLFLIEKAQLCSLQIAYPFQKNSALFQ